MKSVHAKLFEAFQKGRGVRLNANDICELVGHDNAISKVISNTALREAGYNNVEGDDVIHRDGLTWGQYQKLLIEVYCTEEE